MEASVHCLWSSWYRIDYTGRWLIHSWFFLRKDLVSSKPQDYIEFLYMGVGFRLLSNDLNGFSPFPWPDACGSDRPIVSQSELRHKSRLNETRSLLFSNLKKVTLQLVYRDWLLALFSRVSCLSSTCCLSIVKSGERQAESFKRKTQPTCSFKHFG